MIFKDDLGHVFFNEKKKNRERFIYTFYFILLLYIYLLIYYRNWRELVFFTWMCNTIFGIWFRVSISGSKYIKNVCIWHLMLWCITHVCNPALTGLYNGCCRHNRGQLSTRHQQMFIEGALWSYLLSYLSPFDQNSANYVYIYICIYVYRYIYSYIPRVFPHAPWDWNIYPAIWLFDLWGPINGWVNLPSPIPARWSGICLPFTWSCLWGGVTGAVRSCSFQMCFAYWSTVLYHVW